MHKLLRETGVFALVLFAVLMAASSADAQIVSIANNQGQGGCTSSGGPGGTLCFSTSPPNPFLLSDIENGTEVLTIPNTSSTPEWYVENNTGSTVTKLSLIFDGSLASNANLQCNFGGGESGTCSVDGVTNGLNNPIPSGDIPATIIFDITNPSQDIANGEFFEINTASFAHSGQDFGCLAGTAIGPGSSSGTTTCTPVSTPEPTTLSMVVLAGLLFGTAIGFRRVRLARAS